jgi:XTP/dITP diphosphohydrolase
MMPLERILVLATGNPAKVREIRAVLKDLPLKVLSLADLPSVAEPEETGATFADNARAKALYYARATGRWCLADDSGLIVDSLGGEPGVHSARYAADELPAGSPRAVIDAANNRKLLRELAEVEDARRTARFVCHLAMADPQRIVVEATGMIEGRIGHVPAGQNGFGYDPLFLVDDLGRTTAQLESEHKNSISHRGKATREFAEKLRRMLSGSPQGD